MDNTRTKVIRTNVWYKRFREEYNVLIAQKLSKKQTIFVLNRLYNHLNSNQAFRSRVTASSARESLDLMLDDMKEKKEDI
jgi:hypothetical protein